MEIDYSNARKAPFFVRLEGHASPMKCSEACGYVATMAQHLGVSVSANINGVTVYAMPEDDPEDLAKRWDPKAVVVCSMTKPPDADDQWAVEIHDGDGVWHRLHESGYRGCGMSRDDADRLAGRYSRFGESRVVRVGVSDVE